MHALLVLATLDESFVEGARYERGYERAAVVDEGLVQLLDVRRLRRLRQRALLVEQREHAQLAVDERERRRVVGEVEVGRVDALSHVVLLLQPAHGVDEVGLQLFVGIVDAELLERVDRKVLEAEDVKEADRLPIVTAAVTAAAVAASHAPVELCDDPLEERRVDGLCQCVAHIEPLLGRKRHRVRRAAARGDDAPRERVCQRLVVHLEQCGGDSHVLGSKSSLLTIARVEVANVEDRRQQPEDVLLRLRSEPAVLHLALGLLPRVAVGHAGHGRCVASERERLGIDAVAQPVAASLLAIGAGEQLVKHVVGALTFGVRYDARLLQQEARQLARHDLAEAVEADIAPLAEAG
eukprot:7385074-Prymnesium_polylepis.3